MLTPGWFRMFRQVYSDTVLPRAGRAGDEHHAVGPLDRVQQRSLLVWLVAERLDAELGARRIEDPHHDLLAEQRRAAC